MESDIKRNKVEEYMGLFADLRARTGDSHVALGILQEVAKDMRIVQMREERGLGNGEVSVFQSEPQFATMAQTHLLRRLGADVPEGLTKEEASKLIDEMKLKQASKASQ